jgi:DNA-binding transcriptional LysR family regulator
MEIDVIRTFIEVMRAGSFAIVARDRGLYPSSISRAIGGLEEELGVRLFHRNTRRLSPTEAARAYFDRVAPMIDELERAALVAADSDEIPRGTLRMSVPVTFAQERIVPLIPEFAQRYPEVSLDLVLTDAVVDLVEQRIELAIRLGRMADSSLISHRLSSVRYVVCASPEYLRRRGRPKVPSELEGHECLRCSDPAHGPRWRFRQGNRGESAVLVRGRVMACNAIALRSCAVAAMGIAILPHWHIGEELGNGALVEIFPEYQATPSEFDIAAWVLYPSRSYLPLKVRAYVDFLKEKFRNGGVPSERQRPSTALSPNGRLRRRR